MKQPTSLSVVVNSPTPMHIKWSNDNFFGATVPESARDYLMNHGLPEAIPFTTLEFGPALNDDENFVIGCDFEFPIVINADGTVSVIYDSGHWFFNSAVALLDASIGEYLKMKNCNEGSVREAVDLFKCYLADADPKCLTEICSVWRTMIDDFRAMAT